MGEMTNVYDVSVGRSEEKNSWEDNIKMDLE
jgi:hypothetical protein